MTLSQLERIRTEIDNENAEPGIQTPTKWWELGLPEEEMLNAGFVENADAVLDKTVSAA